MILQPLNEQRAARDNIWDISGIERFLSFDSPFPRQLRASVSCIAIRPVSSSRPSQHVENKDLPQAHFPPSHIVSGLVPPASFFFFSTRASEGCYLDNKIKRYAPPGPSGRRTQNVLTYSRKNGKDAVHSISAPPRHSRRSGGAVQWRRIASLPPFSQLLSSSCSGYSPRSGHCWCKWFFFFSLPPSLRNSIRRCEGLTSPDWFVSLTCQKTKSTQTQKGGGIQVRLTSVFRRHFVTVVNGLSLLPNTQQRNTSKLQIWHKGGVQPRSQRCPPRRWFVFSFPCSSLTQTTFKLNSPKPLEINMHMRKLRSALNVGA